MSGQDDRSLDRYGPTDVTPDEFERLVASMFGSLGSGNWDAADPA
jgi:hypothetical protein